MTIYLDNAATTPLLPEARAAMEPFLGDEFANASSLYAGARTARKAIEEARETIAAAVGARPDEVVFTSGGTEADNLAVQGVVARRAHEGRDHIVISAIEHHAVLDTARWLAKQRGARLTEVPVTAAGVIDLDGLEAAVDDATAIVSVMAANNETGAIQPVDRCQSIAARAGARFHSDAVQALPWIAVKAGDLIALSAHKIGGPKGVGALIVRRGVSIEPIVHGGGQERGVRSGTYNVAGIAGFGAAVAAVLARRDTDAARVAAMRDRLQAALLAAIDGAQATATDGARLAGTCHLRIPGVDAETLLLVLDASGVAASSGSACQSGAAEPSHVLQAMGIPGVEARGALRLTLGRSTTDADIDAAIPLIVTAVAKVRR